RLSTDLDAQNAPTNSRAAEQIAASHSLRPELSASSHSLAQYTKGPSSITRPSTASSICQIRQAPSYGERTPSAIWAAYDLAITNAALDLSGIATPSCPSTSSKSGPVSARRGRSSPAKRRNDGVSKPASKASTAIRGKRLARDEAKRPLRGD